MRYSTLWIVLTIAALCAPRHAAGQRLFFGGTVGVNFNALTPETSDQTTSFGPDANPNGRGVSLGAVFGMDFPGAVGVEVAALYMTKGTAGFTARRTFTEQGDDLIVETRETLTPTYVELPMLVTVDIPFGAAPWPAFYVGAGPSVGVKVGCAGYVRTIATSLITGAEVGDERVNLPDCPASFSTIDGSVAATSGVHFGLIGHRGTIGVRYTHGVGTIITSVSGSRHRTLTVFIALAGAV